MDSSNMKLPKKGTLKDQLFVITSDRRVDSLSSIYTVALLIIVANN